MNIMKKCGFCQQPAELMCSRCLEVYCSVECQIRDWADHKKVCVVIPKLYPNDCYLNILAGGVALPLKSSALIEQASVKMMNPHNQRALKPLRKPNIPLGTVEVSVNRDATSKLNIDGDDCTLPKEQSPSSSKPGLNITVTTASGCEKRLSKMKLDELPRPLPDQGRKPSILGDRLKQSAGTDQVRKPAINDVQQPSPEQNQKPVNPIMVPSQPSRPASPESPKPQTLAKLKLEVIKNHQHLVKLANSPEKVDPVSTQPKPWLLHFPLEKKDGELFEVIVEYIVAEQQNRFWVIQASHEADCDKLLRDIHGQLNPKAEPIAYDQIQVDDIFAAPYEEIYYRVVVLAKVDPAKKLVKVRLIDYGNDLTLPASDLRAPLLVMKNLRAFAFQIEVQNLDRPLELCERIRIKVNRSEKDRKIVEIEQVASSEHLLDLLGAGEEKSGGGGIIAVLTSRKALVMLTSAVVKPIMKILYTQLLEAAPKFPQADNPKVGDMVCVDSFGVGWSRGLIIEQHDDVKLVYTVDNGTVDLVSKNDVRALPDEFKTKPRLVVQMEISKLVMNEQEFKQKCYLPSFAFSYERLGFDKKCRSMKGMVRDAEGKMILAEVVFQEFVCDLKQIGINYWPNIPQDKCIVRITSVLDVNTVIICPQDKINVYTELIQTMLPELKLLTAAPAANDVIVGVDDIMMPYRARVLKTVSPSEVELLDLDNGSVKKVSFGKLYAANGFISYLPVYTINVQIRDMNASAVKEQASVLELLDVFKAEKRNLVLLFEGGSYMYGVKLLDVTTNRSLAAILMEHHDKKLREAEANKKAQEDARQQAAAAAAEALAKAKQELLDREQRAAQEAAAQAELEKKANEEEQRKKDEAEATKKAATFPAKLNINDLKLVELPTSRRDVKLTILDDGDLNQGILTVCELNEQNIKRYATLTEEVNKHAAKIGGDGYSPELDELCVAVFDVDKLWYRAVCIQPLPEKNMFLVQFIDYGNVATVKREAIRRLPKELNFPCAAHTCPIRDVDKSLEKLVKQQVSLGHVIATEIHSEGEIYALKF